MELFTLRVTRKVEPLIAVRSGSESYSYSRQLSPLAFSGPGGGASEFSTRATNTTGMSGGVDENF